MDVLTCVGFKHAELVAIPRPARSRTGDRGDFWSHLKLLPSDNGVYGNDTHIGPQVRPVAVMILELIMILVDTSYVGDSTEEKSADGRLEVKGRYLLAKTGYVIVACASMSHDRESESHDTSTDQQRPTPS